MEIERSIVNRTLNFLFLCATAIADIFRKKRASTQEWTRDVKVEKTPDLDEVLTLNVSGQVYQTFSGTLGKYPDTLLGSNRRRRKFYVKNADEYFFDRHRSSFDSILYFYQSGGILRRPPGVPLDVFMNELRFFDFPNEIVEPFLLSEGYSKPLERLLPKRKWQALLWQTLEHPDSSRMARYLGFFSIFVIVVSVVTFCLETLPQFKDYYEKGNGIPRYENPFFIIESICIVYFTVELLLRFASCPDRKVFCMSFLNWVDLIAIAPFFVSVALRESSAVMSFTVLRILRLFRVFRIFKLSRHSRGLRILGETFRASIRELCLLCFLVMIAVVLFSSIVYFLENHIVSGNQFTSIPEAFWYAVVTMTTVGYGDITPKGPLGRLVGSTCAILGVLVIALPVPVIVENFKHFYRQENRIALVDAVDDVEDGPVKFDTMSSSS